MSRATTVEVEKNWEGPVSEIDLKVVFTVKVITYRDSEEVGDRLVGFDVWEGELESVTVDGKVLKEIDKELKQIFEDYLPEDWWEDVEREAIEQAKELM